MIDRIIICRTILDDLQLEPYDYTTDLIVCPVSFRAQPSPAIYEYIYVTLIYLCDRDRASYR